MALFGFGPALAADNAGLSSPLSSLLTGQPWLNSPALQPADVQGKVVLVNFWTYSCINSLRFLPYTRAWSQKYKDRGLVIIGVHTPEFAFEKDPDNVRQAISDLHIDYPVTLDNDYKIWRSFRNSAWPALYFLDAKGKVVRRTLGEGEYDEDERLIDKLLSENTNLLPAAGKVAVEADGVQASADFADLASPETYLGYAQFTNFASRGYVNEDRPQLYRGVDSLSRNHWALQGTWTIGSEFATLSQTPGSIVYRFHARDLHLVMVNPTPGQPIRFRIKIDGGAPGDNRGVDVDKDGAGKVEESRLYQLVRLVGPVRDHTFEIEFLDPGVRAYVFTFG